MRAPRRLEPDAFKNQAPTPLVAPSGAFPKGHRSYVQLSDLLSLDLVEPVEQIPVRHLRFST